MNGTRIRANKIKSEISSKQTLVNGKHSNDSFDRFGDDLCQVLLSYLPLSQKFRFECVSKQWRSLIFNKQQKLILDFYEVLNNNTIKTPKDRNKYELMFKKLFSKLKFLKDIECHHFFNTETINSIIDNCLLVEKIGFNGNINENLLLKLCQKFSDRLISFDLSGIFQKRFDGIFKFTPNLRQLRINKNLNQLIKTHLTKLEDISLPKNVSLEELKIFTDIYCEQIKKIHVSFECLPNDDTNKALMILSRYQNLESLSLNIKLPKNRASIIDSGLAMIGNECKRLTQFSLKAYNKITNENLFLIMSRFRALVKLIIRFNCSSEQSFGNMYDLSGCKSLKCLNLFVKSLRDENFSDVHLCLPNLKYFLLLSENDLTDDSLLSLAKLQNLLRIEINTSKATDSGVCYVISNCQQIKTIIIYRGFQISKTSIEAFIKLALKNPKLQYEFVFPFNDLKSLTKRKIPLNLSVESSEQNLHKC